METITRLRDAAKANILEYCNKNNCIDEYDLFEAELIRQSDGFNLKLPIDFYVEFYNKSLTLLKENKL